jgi:hypothetical protein
VLFYCGARPPAHDKRSRAPLSACWGLRVWAVLLRRAPAPSKRSRAPLSACRGPPVPKRMSCTRLAVVCTHAGPAHAAMHASGLAVQRADGAPWRGRVPAQLLGEAARARGARARQHRRPQLAGASALDFSDRSSESVSVRLCCDKPVMRWSRLARRFAPRCHERHGLWAVLRLGQPGRCRPNMQWPL